MHDPICPQCRTPMACVEHNYHGTREDIYQCPKCQKHFAVSYRVASIDPAPDWDTPQEGVAS